jgi:hypothetical protein
MIDNEGTINRLQNESEYFQKLSPQEQLFVSEYCSNGFNATLASKAVGAKTPAKFMKKDTINKAVEEFVKAVLGDKVGKLKSMIIDVLWQRAFYNVFDIITEEGEPRFDISNYKEVLGTKAVVIDGVKPYVHTKNQDYRWVEIQFADRNKALKELSNFVGLVHDDTDKTEAGFVVKIDITNQKKKEPKIMEYVAPKLI